MNIVISPDLVQKARAGDRQAMAAIYEQSYPELWRTVRILVRSEEETADILQDSYVKAFSRLDQLSQEEALLPWLRRIAVNTARDQLRKSKPLLFSELTEEAEDPLPEQAEQDPALLPDQALGLTEKAQ